MSALGDLGGVLGPAAGGYAQGQLQGLQNARAQAQQAVENQRAQSQLELQKSQLGLQTKEFEHRTTQDNLAVYNHLHDQIVAELHDPATRDTWIREGTYQQKFDHAQRLGHAIASGDLKAIEAVAGEYPQNVAHAANVLGKPNPIPPASPLKPGNVTAQNVPNAPLNTELIMPSAAQAQPRQPLDVQALTGLLQAPSQGTPLFHAAAPASAPGGQPAAPGAPSVGAFGPPATQQPGPINPPIPGLQPGEQKALDNLDRRHLQTSEYLSRPQQPYESNQEYNARLEQAARQEDTYAQARDRIIAPSQKRDAAIQQEKLAANKQAFEVEQKRLDRENQLAVTKLLAKGRDTAADQAAADRKAQRDQQLKEFNARQQQQREITDAQIKEKHLKTQLTQEAAVSRVAMSNRRGDIFGLERSLPVRYAVARDQAEKLVAVHGFGGSAGASLADVGLSLRGDSHLTQQFGFDPFATPAGKQLKETLAEAQGFYLRGVAPIATTEEQYKDKYAKITPQDVALVKQLWTSKDPSAFSTEFKNRLADDVSGISAWRLTRAWDKAYRNSGQLLPPSVLDGLRGIFTGQARQFGVSETDIPPLSGTSTGPPRGALPRRTPGLSTGAEIFGLPSGGGRKSGAPVENPGGLSM